MVTRVATPHRYVGLSGDEKPIFDDDGQPIPAGSEFIEIDTGLKYILGGGDGLAIDDGEGEGEGEGESHPHQWGMRCYPCCDSE